MSPAVAPNARRVPISCVRSLTAIHVIATIPSPNQRACRNPPQKKSEPFRSSYLCVEQTLLVLNLEIIWLIRLNAVQLMQERATLVRGRIHSRQGVDFKDNACILIEVHESTHCG
jgi:hypothetical protein